MAFCRLVFPLLVLSVVSAANVPVFLWGDLPKTSEGSNPLKTTTAPAFEAILKSELAEDPFVVIFADKYLSPEDFSLKQNGEVSLPYLRNELDDSRYLPSVQDPLLVLDDISDNAERVKLTENGLSKEINYENSKFVIISLEDYKEGESRFDTLRRHNDFILEQFAKIKESRDNVVGIFTAEYPHFDTSVTHSRVRRQANETVNISPPDYMMEGLRLYVKDIMLTTNNFTSNITGYVKSDSEIINGSLVRSTMHFDGITLTLNFRSASGYWFFDTVILNATTPTTINEELYPTSNVEAILGFSYRCKQLVTFSSVNDTLHSAVTFEDMKVQPFFEGTNATTLAFGDSFNCVGFFSAPIWSGLFVVFILLSITFYGIMMMMDIRTMDRFDDPKGKTITINAAE